MALRDELPKLGSWEANMTAVKHRAPSPKRYWKQETKGTHVPFQCPQTRKAVEFTFRFPSSEITLKRKDGVAEDQSKNNPCYGPANRNVHVQQLNTEES